MLPVPHEFAIGGIFLPPLLIAAVVGVLTAVVTARLLDRYRLSRFFASPPLVLVGLSIIYTVLFGSLFIGI